MKKNKELTEDYINSILETMQLIEESDAPAPVKANPILGLLAKITGFGNMNALVSHWQKSVQTNVGILNKDIEILKQSKSPDAVKSINDLTQYVNQLNNLSTQIATCVPTDAELKQATDKAPESDKQAAETEAAKIPEQPKDATDAVNIINKMVADKKTADEIKATVDGWTDAIKNDQGVKDALVKAGVVKEETAENTEDAKAEDAKSENTNTDNKADNAESKESDATSENKDNTADKDKEKDTDNKDATADDEHKGEGVSEVDMAPEDGSMQDSIQYSAQMLSKLMNESNL